jgi:single-stranded DNA-binding protein
VEGKLHTEDWTDRDGGKRSDIKMTVTDVHFCGPKDGGGTSGSTGNRPTDGPAYPAKNNDFAEIGEEDGELPF